MLTDLTQSPRDPDSGVFLIGQGIDYQDSGEAEVARIIGSAADRSSASDELSQAAHNWPTTYHLSRARSNLLRPLGWEKSHQVLEVGAGCGALTRYLGEIGVSVDAIEGNMERARIAALRCAGIANIRIAAGQVEALDTSVRYDVATVIGVLEYSGRYGSDAVRLLRTVAGLLKNTGVLVLAIENQLGLKYLMGHSEDHLGRPFVGIEGYEPDEGVRTFSRTALLRLLEEAGFRHSSWFYPFPDYKLPTSILAHEIASDPACAQTCSSLIRTPVLDHVSPPLVSYDTRRALRTWAEAGLLPEVSNSFLVVASMRGEALRRFLPCGRFAWQFTDPSRSSMWGVMRSFGLQDTASLPSDSIGSNRGRVLLKEVRSTRLVGAETGLREKAWLRQTGEPFRPFLAGRNLQDAVRSASVGTDEVELARILENWIRYLETQCVDAGPQGAGNTPNPFNGLPGLAGAWLPGHFLDVNLDNFIETTSGIADVDLEWSVDGAVSLHAVCLRALWYLSGHLVEWGRHPWDLELPRSALVEKLCRLIRLAYSESLMDKLFLAEAEFQGLITGGDVSLIAEQLRSQSRFTAAAVARSKLRRLDDLENDVQRMQRWAESAVRDVEIRDAEIYRLQAVLKQLQFNTDAEIAALRATLSDVRLEKQELIEELNRSRKASRTEQNCEADPENG